MHSSKTFDIILWGATGFTGKLVATYLFKKYGSDGDIKWAMAGRNIKKLEAVRTSVADETVPLIVADSNDPKSLTAMVQQTKVLCTTVGPYAKYGSKLVAACVDNNTHYCDLAGEVQWIRQMIDEHHQTAKEKGVKIVHCCGFDSIPSDLGVYFIQKEAKAQKRGRAKIIKMRVAGMRGRISGGTYASISNVIAQARKDKKIYKTLNNPYGLNPIDEQKGKDQHDLRRVVFDAVSNTWIAPFVMASINTKIVRRSNALSGNSYGKDFQYEEASIAGKGLKGRIKGVSTTLPIAVVMGAKPGSFLKKIVDSYLPKPGEGPSSKQQTEGYFNFRFYITMEDGSTAYAKVTGDRDPGYGSTSKMLAEAAICLAKDPLTSSAGVITPSIAMGDALLARLENNAGLTFSFHNGSK